MEYSEAAVEDKLRQFLGGYQDERGELKYRIQISNLPATQGKSVTVDYPDLERYDTDLATSVVKQPDLFLKSFDDAALEILNLYNPTHADKVKKELHVRLRELTDRISLRGVTKEQLNTLIMVAGMVTRTSELRPLAVNAAFRCSNRHITMVEQDGAGTTLKRPIKCETEGCGETRNFELDEKRTEFIDFQVIKIQEMPEELPPGQLPQSFDVNMTGDLVNNARPGDRVVLTGIVKAESESVGGTSRKLFITRIEANFTEQLGKRPEELAISREEEEQIKTIAALPGAYDKLVASVAPAIFGHELHKEAALLLMVGSPQKSLPDGSTLRGDINILMVGDPGCLVYDERIVLGDGTITKIGQMGVQHLQRLSTPVLTGEGGGRRAEASRFHIYKRQPVMEIITESGKSLKGTYNHPVLARTREFGSRDNEWRRLDQIKVGDRVVVTSGFPCSKTAFVATSFKPVKRKSRYGPSFKGKLPAIMDEDLASLCGYMLGDGWVRKTGEQSGLVVSDTDVDILPKLLNLTKTLFGMEAHVVSRKAPGRTVLLHYATINSKDIAANLSFIQTKRVPDLILASGNKVVSKFLKWLYEADGTVFPLKRGVGSVALKSVEVELLRDVQVLLLRFGIHSRVNGNTLVIRRGGDITKFARAIGFASLRKKERLRNLEVKARTKRSVHGQRIERVAKIVLHEPQDVYDIEVPNGHRFIANGIISHNTAKSELLKYVARVAPRGLFTSGRGSTAAGLTAAVVKEKNGMMMLEAGATVLADLGVACLHPSSKVVFDGRIISVEYLAKDVFFEKGLSDGKFSEVGEIAGFVPSLNTETLKIETERCTKIRRRWHAGKIINLKLRSGFDIKVTPDHLLLDGNSLAWKEAGQFVPKDSLVSPLLLPQQSNSKHVYLWDILPDNTKVSLTDEERSQLRHLIEQKYESLAEAGRELELPRLASYFQGLQPSLRELKTLTSALGVEGSWKSVCHIYDKSKLFVSEITPELGYICGFILGDGHVSITKRRATITIHQSIVHSEYIEQLRRCWDKVFQVPFKIGKARIEKSRIRGQNVVSNAVNWHVSRRVLANVYDYLIQNNLARILSLPEEALVGFLSGLTDADGCITHKTSKKNRASFSTWNIVYTFSSNRESNLNLLLGLRRFDCLGSYRGSKRGVGVVVVSGRRDCLQLQKALSLSVKMRKRPGLRRYDISGASEKIPSVPVANIVRQVFAQVPRAELIGLGIWSSIYESMNLKRRASVTQMQRIISKYSSFPEESKNALTKLMNRDYFLDDIVGIEDSDYEGFVYDLVLQGNNHNFVADGTIVHNCIDEFDKMRVEDRSALHEVMEQQTVSVAKGGIIATLNARTSILAAANPVDGKYDPYKNILDNVALPIPLMTRFDLIFIIRDEPDPGQDETVAKHILDMRAKSSFPEAPPIDFELLKKYIIYAKKLDPEFTEEASNRLSSYYIKLRREASPDQISVTPRWLEGMIRLSIARARLLLHPRVMEDDALHAVNLVERMLNTVAVDQATKKVDVGVLYNKPVSEKGLREAALDVFKRLSGDAKQPVEDKAFYDEMEKTGKFSRDQAEKVFQDMWKSGVIFEVRAHFFKKA